MFVEANRLSIDPNEILGLDSRLIEHATCFLRHNQCDRETLHLYVLGLMLIVLWDYPISLEEEGNDPGFMNRWCYLIKHHSEVSMPIDDGRYSGYHVAFQSLFLPRYQRAMPWFL